jgi:glycosyltransferase involved in cell wall biosynthesis
MGYQETYLAKMHSQENITLVIASDRYSRVVYEANRNLLKRRKVGTGYFTESGISVLRLPALFDIPLLEEPWLLGLERATAGFRPDIIIVHGIVSLVSIQIARTKSRLNSTKLIFDDHMAFNATRGGWVHILYWVFRKVFTPILLKTVDCFVAVASESKHFMEREYGIPSHRIEIIPLGADRHVFRFDANDRLSVRNEYGITDSDVVFIYVGKLIPEKGVHLLVQVGIQLCSKHPDVKMMLVGGGPNNYVEELKENIEEADLLDRFVFIESVPNQDLPKYYSAADVGVWPLQASICMVEAMSCGLPIIISDGSRTPERVSENNGLLYHERDVTDLERMMEKLLDKRLRRTMAHNADRYAAKHNWEILAKRFLELAL